MPAEFHGHVFIACSLDGFIAREDGDIKWLTERGDPGSTADTGYDAFIETVDGLIIGRGTWDAVLEMDQYWYAGQRVLVVSNTLAAEDITHEGATVHRSIEDAIATFTGEGRSNAYVDGGKLIQEFLRRGLVESLVITRVPVLLGSGAPLFGPLDADINLELTEQRELGSGFVQQSYKVI
jgi:dihydrofolate reductase